MKYLIVFMLLIASSLSLSRGGSELNDRDPSFRDYEYNEMRDVVIPMMDQWEKYKNMTPEEREEENRLRDENIARYPEFHRDLDRSDIGEDSER